MEETTLGVTGMACGGCEDTVTETLDAVDGISSVTASHEDDEVDIEYDAETVDTATISDAIEDAGYEVA